MNRKQTKRIIIFSICLMLMVCLYGENAKKPILTLDQMRMEIAKRDYTFTVGKNSVTDKPLEMLCGLKEPPDWRQKGRFDGGCKGELTLPTSFDWRGYGVVNSIKNQGSCGSCWAFGTIGSYESCVAVVGGGLDNLSEEWLLDCNSYGYDCGGGWWAFGDLTNGAPLTSCYPYVGSAGSCDTSCSKYHPMTAWYYVGTSSGVPSTTDIKNAILNQGPIAVAVCADYYFQAYTGGIFTHTSSGSLNHAVILVGWNDSSGGYWILRNSWGSGWGESGYMRIAYDANSVGYAAAYGVPENVTPQPPVADFSGNPTTVEKGNPVQFTDTSTNNPTSWSWTFEGGTPTSSTNQNPTVTYNTIGTYSVTLTVCNEHGCDTETKVDYITVQEDIIEYCDSQGNDYNYEWIERVVVGPLDNSSGAAGYTDFTSITANLTAGGTFNVSLTPGFSSYIYTEHWKIWIDYNVDGDFEDAEEEVFNAVSDTTVTGNFTVPTGVYGLTRMRVSMKWNSDPTPCETFSYGEVEDYTVNLISPDASTFLLWTRDGSAHLWKFNSNGGWAGAIGYGYASGWTATSYQRNGDGSAQLLWTRDGSAHLWKFNSSGGWAGATGYGYTSGWTATSHQRNSDGSAQLLWTRDGSAHLWKFNSSGGWAGATGFGYSSGWTATAYQRNSDGSAQLLWTRNGSAHLWRFNSSGGWDGSKGFGYTGWRATSYHNSTSSLTAALQIPSIMLNYEPDWTGTNYPSRISSRDPLLETPDNMINYTDYAKDFPVEVVENLGDTVNEVNFAQQIQETDFELYNEPEVPYIIIRKAGTGGGAIIANGLRCGNKCVELIIPYDKNAVETLRVVPDAGSYFAGWKTPGGFLFGDIRNVQPGEAVIAVFDTKDIK